MKEKNTNVKRRRGLKALIAVGVIVVVLTVFLSVLLNDTTINEGLGSLNGEYGTVLADVTNITVANPRLVDIAMLGAHDAVTDKLTPDSPMDYYDRGTILGKLDPITSGFQYRFGKTQTVSLDKQLLQGARFFHIKCTYFDGEWYATHAHLSGKIADYVTEVLQFLDSHPGEIVCLLFQPMYFGDTQTYASFHEWLATVKYNGKSIYDFTYGGNVNVFNSVADGTKIGELRYNDLTLNGTRAGVVLFDRREQKIYKAEYEGEINAYTYKFFDMDRCAIHEWHSRMGVKVLIEKINETADMIAATDAYDDVIRMNQTQASFSAGGFTDVMVDIGTWSLLRFAARYNVKLVENEKFDYWLSQMPVFQVDFVNSDKGGFNEKVNAKIHAYNENLCAQ